MMDQPLCPANYFGKGKNHILSEDPDEIRKFERQWLEWETANPHDPIGEISLAAWEKHVAETHKATTTIESRREADGVIPIAAAPPPKTESIPLGIPEDTYTGKMKLELPLEDIQILRKFAAYHRVRPRDVISKLIKSHCRMKI